MEIKFIDYTGKYPNLCSGTLRISLDGKVFELFHALDSAGSAYMDSNWDGIVKTGDWMVNEDMLPEELKPYVNEIEKLANENIEYGCCGGCL